MGDIMNHNRQNMHRRRRRRRRRFTKRFLALVFTVFAGIFAFVMINVLGIGENGEDNGANGTQYLEHIDISQLRTNFDDISLIYIFYYVNTEMDMSRHHIIDDYGLVYFITHIPEQNAINITTIAPVVFFTQYSYDTRNVYITVVNPRDVYSRILIIDPGHGGADTGAIVGNIHESSITLAIGLFLYELFQDSESGIKAYLTRNDDSFVYNAHRAHVANTVGDLLLSIHTNSYEDSTAVSGTETLFNNNSPMSRYGNLGRYNLTNSAFSQIMQNHLVAELGTRDRGLVERPDLLLLNVSSVPTAYVEIDFKTNPQALLGLTNPAYQQRIARALYNGVIEAFERAENGSAD